ncbi:MAG TPA: molybdate ABC transporter substrate-binding protein [Terriglobales bacterium]|nr:molybdate ABC transporter substrate-binding protein [Terriglobales bacterium]
MKAFLLSLLLLVCTAPLLAQELTVAAAADLRPALDEINAKFKAESGIELHISYGSSGNFFQQLQNGAPFDVFLSANVDYPKKLAQAGLVASGTYYEFARGSIVLIVPYDSKIDLTEGLHALLTPAVKKIAIANPSHAPYGQAAVAAIKSMGIYDWVAPHLVMGENISEAASFVFSGAADVGIVAKSLALAPAAAKRAKFVDIAAKNYPPLLQAMVVMKSAKDQSAAARFETFMRSEDTKKILQQFGFDLP